jgi:hypothetical protein
MPRPETLGILYKERDVVDRVLLRKMKYARWIRERDLCCFFDRLCVVDQTIFPKEGPDQKGALHTIGMRFACIIIHECRKDNVVKCRLIADRFFKIRLGLNELVFCAPFTCKNAQCAKRKRREQCG